MKAIRDLTWVERPEAKFAILGSIAALAVLVIGYALEIEAPTLALMVFHVAALTVLAVAWQKAETAARTARRNAEALDFLAGRLIRLEQQARLPSPASPVLRSTMAEVTGTVGMLGGVVRELARNVAAQHRDVADIKVSLQHSSGEADGPALQIVPERPAPAASHPSTQPDPALLPVRPSTTDEELRRRQAITRAFEADGIELHLQPVVALPRRKVRFYEALARLRLEDGTLLAPGEFLAALERLGRGPEFDRRVLERSIAVTRHLMSRGSEAIVTVNLSPRSVTNTGFLNWLTALADASPDIAGKLVLEVPQSCWRSLDHEQKQALARLAEGGFPLSLDHAPDLVFDAPSLARHGVRFLKLRADMLIATATADRHDPENSVREFASLLRRAGIKLVAERVEHEDMVPALADLDIPLAQGFVFAAPRALRSDVLGQDGASDLRKVG